MTILKKIRRWFRLKFDFKRKHIFNQDVSSGYLPCLPMDSRTKAYYKSKISRNTETFMSSRFKSSNKKCKKS